jgi:hypothetical protein
MATRFSILIAALAITSAATSVGRADDPQFEQPVEITAGGKTYVQVLYPSPVLYDVNGDGKRDLIIGDLQGYLQFAERDSSGASTNWSTSKMMQDANGKDIKFSNW